MLCICWQELGHLTLNNTSTNGRLTGQALQELPTDVNTFVKEFNVDKPPPGAGDPRFPSVLPPSRAGKVWLWVCCVCCVWEGLECTQQVTVTCCRLGSLQHGNKSSEDGKLTSEEQWQRTADLESSLILDHRFCLLRRG
jgi:hypothetical protein